MSESSVSSQCTLQTSAVTSASEVHFKPAPAISLLGKQRRYRNLLLLVEKGSGAGEENGKEDTEEGSGEEV